MSDARRETAIQRRDYWWPTKPTQHCKAKGSLFNPMNGEQTFREKIEPPVHYPAGEAHGIELMR
jgi:hypothetical protein